MVGRLLMFVPEEAYLLLMVLAGFMLMAGFRKAAMGLAGVILLLAVLDPFVDSLIGGLPTWLFAMLCLVLLMSVIRMFLGKGVSEHLVAMTLFSLMRMPFRFIGRLLRGRLSDRNL